MVKKNEKACKNHAHNDHPDHQKLIPRLNRAKGQVEAVIKMVNEKAYCPNIIQQIRAAAAALKIIEAEILQAHLQSCVKMALRSDSELEASEKINELMILFKRGN